jgi:peptidyl-prolyl cis-trans isomerase SurA
MQTTKSLDVLRSRPALVLSAWLLVLPCVIGIATRPAAAQQDVNRIVLRVNDQILTLFAYEKRKNSEINAILADPRIAPADRQERLSQVGRDVMQQTFREMLLESFAAQNAVVTSEQEVDGAIQGTMEQRGIKSLDELQQALAASNMTMDDLRRSLRQELLLSGVVRREVTGKIEVPEDELRSYYRSHPQEFQVAEERWLQEVIVLSESGLSETELTATAERLYGELSGGGDFQASVASYQDQGLTTGVIDLGWLKEGELEASLSNAAFALAAGQYSKPVEAKGGYHLLFAKEVKEGYVLPYDQVSDLILARERQRRFGSELRKFMAQLESHSFIEEDLPPEAVGFRTLADDYQPEAELSNFRAPLVHGEAAKGKAEDAAPTTAAAEDAAPPGGGGSP